MTGLLLGKRYELLEMIDSGGMADIYKALCKKTNSIVAVKVLKECFSDNAEYIDRFKKEAESVFSLEHENIVRVTDIGYDESAYYMVMEFVEGSTLKALIDRRKRLNEKETAEYALQVCSALSAAHKKGIIHRDIKPHNVLIDNSGRLKLTDFGIAKSVASKEDEEDKVIGSVHYISPEQAQGERVDARSDIYSLGIMMYEMLTGVLPHTGGKTVSVALKHINEQITPPIELDGEISLSLNNIILKATQKNKRNRYQSAADLKKDLLKSFSEPGGTFVDLPASYGRPKDAAVKKKNMLWKFGMLFLIVGAIASLITAGIALFGSAKQAFVIPDFVGLSIETASKNISNMTLSTLYEPSESAKEGVVISQSPEAGANADNASSITLTISSGPAAPVMPVLDGMTLEEAAALIDTMGFAISEDNIAYEYHQDIPPGIIVSHTPDVGSPITQDDIISVIVSDENEMPAVVMPDLSDKLVDQAVSFLSDSGFETCFVYEEDSKLSEGTVISQFPEKGIQTTYSEAVSISVSRYKKRYHNYGFSAVIDVLEKESKVKTVIQEVVNGVLVNFVYNENIEDAGRLSLSLDLGSIFPGKKTVIVFVNNVEVSSREVEFR